MFSIDRNSVSSLKFQALNADNYTFWSHPADTENGTARSSIGLISTSGEIFFSKVNMKKAQ